MKVEGKTLEFDSSLWVEYGGVDVEPRGASLAVTGRDDDSYLKVLSHFGRVLKLYTFEAGHWVDADTGAEPLPLDESQAGHVSVVAAAEGGGAVPGPRKAASGAGKRARAAAGAAAKPATGPATKPAAKTAAKPAARSGTKPRGTGGRSPRR